MLLTFLYFFNLLFIPVSDTPIEDWKLKKDKDNIQVYTRKSEGSDIFEYKALTTLNTSDLDALVDIVFQAENYPEWIEHIKEGKILEDIDSENKIAYSVAKLPFPFKNRDVVTLMTLDSGNDYRQINITGNPDHIEHVNGMIRVPLSKGHWRFEKTSDNKIKVYYQFLSDPGGQIPTWVINAFIVDGPYKTLLNLRKMVR